MPTPIETIRDALTCAEILQSFDAEFIPASTDSISGDRPSYIILRGRIQDLSQKHFSSGELQEISIELDQALASIMRKRAEKYVHLIRTQL